MISSKFQVHLTITLQALLLTTQNIKLFYSSCLARDQIKKKDEKLKL